MKIRIVSPFPEGFPCGSNTTAYRWARLLVSLGHEVVVTDLEHDCAADLLVALGAVKCSGLLLRSYRESPKLPVCVALTGSDLAGLAKSGVAQSATGLATKVIVFQPAALDLLPKAARRNAEVILQAAQSTRSRPLPRRDSFVVTLAANLRVEKNPLLAARAARLLRPESQVRIEHFGAVLDEALADEARAEMTANGRYHWMGAASPASLRKRLAASQALIVPSDVEAGANIVSEAVVDGVPILASRIPGNTGVLGGRYSGYFTPGDAGELAQLLHELETSPAFARRLRATIDEVAKTLRPSEEKRCWRRVLNDIVVKLEKPSARAKGSSGL